MSYITQQQLEDRYGERMIVQLSDRAVPGLGLIDVAVVARAIADTDALIDGYLTGRYALPLASTPPLLTDIAGEIAIYKLHRKSPDEKIVEDYNNAVKRLSDISKGVIRLNVEGAEPAMTSGGGVRTNEPERPFTNDSLKGFI
jgi:phage gp36-like protein